MLAIAMGATTILVALFTYPKEHERPSDDEPSTTPEWKSSIFNLTSQNQVYLTTACFLGYIVSCTSSSFARATIQEHSP
jgi:hypothetical protein